MIISFLILFPLGVLGVVAILAFGHYPIAATFGDARSQITPDGAVWLETTAPDDSDQYDLMRWHNESRPVVHFFHKGLDLPVVYPAYTCRYPLAVTNQQVPTRMQTNLSNPHETWLVYSEGALMDGVGVTGVKSNSASARSQSHFCSW
jgi:hypothetical protein